MPPIHRYRGISLPSDYTVVAMTPDKPKLEEAISWQIFLASTPPNVARLVAAEYPHVRTSGGRDYAEAKFVDVNLWCRKCGGERQFAPTTTSEEFAVSTVKSFFLHYRCKNCGGDAHSFSLRLGPRPAPGLATVFKYGQVPNFGIRISASLKKLLSGDDRDLFNKGLLAEDGGLGIGAFSYYRRVLDNQRVKIFDRVIDAAKMLGGDNALIDELTKAKTERQFTRAVEPLKQALPQFLYIEGHNPLTLLYDAVSNGMHAETDGECLTSAQTIRTLLEHLLLKADEALQSDDVVKGAVNKLLEAKQRREEHLKAKKSGERAGD